jgi:hypothetical protein
MQGAGASRDETRCGCACVIACVVVVVELLGSSCPSQRLQMANFPFRISTWDRTTGSAWERGFHVISARPSLTPTGPGSRLVFLQ